MDDFARVLADLAGDPRLLGQCPCCRKVRLLDRPPGSREAEKLHESLRSVIRKGDYLWRSFWIAPGRSPIGRLRKSNDTTTIPVDLSPTEGSV